MRRYLQHNFSYKLISVVIAFLLWSHVRNLRSSENHIDIKYVDVPLTYLNKPNDLEVVGGTTSVKVGIRGHKDEIQKISPADLSAQIDLGGVTVPGSYRMKIAYVLPPRINFTDLQEEPLTALVNLEQIISRMYPVQVTLDSQPPEGIRVGTPEVSPVRVKVSGRSSLVSKVRIVFTKIPVGELTSSYDKDTRAFPVDRMGVPIHDLQVDPQMVHVRLEVSLAEISKSVPIKPQVVGTPAPGYEIDEITCEPDTIDIYGEPDQVNRIRSIPTEKIDISDSKATTSRLVPLRPPAHLRVGNTRVRVTVALRLVAPVANGKAGT